MKLLYSPTSPFARKVRVVARELGAIDDIEEVVTNPFAPDSPVAAANPLGKIPALVLDDGSALFDSTVICEYLHSRNEPPSLFPRAGARRWRALRLAALADGVMEAVLQHRLESLRPEEKQHPPYVDRLLAAIRRSLASLGAVELDLSSGVTIGHVSLGCAFGYLDLRLGGEDWRSVHPSLAEWYASFAERPSMLATAHPI